METSLIPTFKIILSLKEAIILKELLKYYENHQYDIGDDFTSEQDKIIRQLLACLSADINNSGVV